MKKISPYLLLSLTILFWSGNFVLGILPFFLWELAGGATMVVTPAVVAGILYLALFPSILAYIFWNHAVAAVGARRAGFFIYLMPAFGTLLSVVFLHETLLIYHLAGVIFIFFGVYFTTTGQEPVVPKSS